MQYLQYIAGQEGVTYDDEALHIIAQRADGGMRDALSMFDRVVSFCGAQLTGDKVAESLNVLDYNTYFAATELILAGNYAELLTLFDGVLRRGFEGQLFIAGLNGHMRDLLMCKNPQTAGLLEVTGQVAERYREQANAEGCDAGFLFNAINLLTQTDTGYRTATNRRLHAELALIKLCGLGGLKKKDDTVGAAGGDSEADALVLVAGVGRYPMPAILNGGAVEQPKPVAVSAVPATRTVPEETAASPSESTPKSTLALKPTPEPKSEPVREVAAQTASAAASSVHASPKTGGESARPATGRSITGVSIANLQPLTDGNTAGGAAVQTAEGAGPDEVSVRPVAPEEAEKMIAEKYDELLRIWKERQRPRLATALTAKRIRGNEVVVSVPNEVLADEINQAKWEIEHDLRQLTGVAATVAVVVSEVQQAYKPVSTEDKLQYLVHLNPNILKLRDELDLTV